MTSRVPEIQGPLEGRLLPETGLGAAVQQHWSGVAGRQSLRKLAELAGGRMPLKRAPSRDRPAPLMAT